MRCYNIEFLAPKNGLSIHEIWVRIIHGYSLFSRMDRPFFRVRIMHRGVLYMENYGSRPTDCREIATDVGTLCLYSLAPLCVCLKLCPGI